MRILHLKKSRAVRLVAAVFILTPILYLLYTSKSSEEEELPRASHKRYKAVSFFNI